MPFHFSPEEGTVITFKNTYIPSQKSNVKSPLDINQKIDLLNLRSGL